MRLKITLILVFSLFLAFEAQAQCGATFEEQNGIAVLEAETASLPSNWKKETAKTPFTGSSYISWRGSQSFGTPGNGTINYTIRINNPGKYRIIWRNVIGIVASSNATTEHNDSWLRMPDADEFYGEKGSSRVYPKGTGQTPNPEGASADGWFKVYANSLNWNWSTFTSDFDGHFVYAEFDSAGVYTLQISARSTGHFIDRIVLYKESQYSAAQAQSLSRAETKCDGSSPPPPPPPGDNQDPIVNITNPAEGENFNAGSDVTVNLSASDPDGSVAKHEIFVNGSKVDTDGSNYSPHIIRNVTEGNYTVRALVTDNVGATAESIVNFTVGDASPPPPPPPPGDNQDPIVNITNPAEGENFNAGSDVTVNLSASDPDGSVAKHEIFVNGSKVDTDGSNYTPHIIRNVTEGNYTVRALVTDNEGATAESIVNFTVGDASPPPPPPPPGDNIPPTVSITRPNNGQNFSVGSDVVVDLDADDSDGNVVKHEIFVNGSKVDTDGTNFTPHTIRNITSGSYAIRALVTDNEGATAETTVNITVGDSAPPPPPPSGNIGIHLINAITDVVIGPLPEGSLVDDGTDINIRATSTYEGTSSLLFNLSGATNRSWTENVAPYALFGDVAGDYNRGNLNSGSHRLVVIVYSGPNRSGTRLGSRTVNFTVANGSGKTAAEVYAYPNPVKGNTFSVKLPESTKGEVLYRLINTSGAEIETGKINVQGTDSAQFNVQSFNNKNNGVYYLLIQTGVSSYAVPIIKE